MKYVFSKKRFNMINLIDSIPWYHSAIVPYFISRYLVMISILIILEITICHVIVSFLSISGMKDDPLTNIKKKFSNQISVERA